MSEPYILYEGPLLCSVVECDSCKRKAYRSDARALQKDHSKYLCMNCISLTTRTTDEN